MDNAATPIGLSPNRDQPLAALAALKQDAASAGRINSLIFTPSFGGITIPVVNGVQSFAGSKAASQAGGTAGDPMGDAHPWDVSIQPQANNNNVNSAVYWQLRWWVKGAAFASPIRLLDLGSVGPSALPFYNTASSGQKVIASAVEVTFWAVTNQAPGFIKNLPVSVAITPCTDLDACEQLSMQWAQGLAAISGNILDKAGNKFLQGGSLVKFSGTLKTAGAAALYPMLIDVADVGSLVSGTSTPIEGSVLAGLTTAGQQASVGDDIRPGTINFNQGLVFALSTTPDVYTAPAAGAVCKTQIQVGT